MPNTVPTDSPSIFEALATLQTSNPPAYNAIVRPNNPPAGIGGYLFDIPGDEEVRLRSAISRHYVESNTPISDHITLEPEMITLRGVVAELANGLPATPTQAPAPNPLPVLPAMSPGLTPGQQQTASATAPTQGEQASGLYQYYLSGSPAGSLTRQTNAFLFFQQAWWGRQLMSVETPWGIFLNMAIADLRVVQSKETKYLSDFTVILEKIRVAGEATVNAGQLAGRNALQQAPVSQNGAAGQVTPTAAQAAALYEPYNPGP
jgi:hypothetical protein